MLITNSILSLSMISFLHLSNLVYLSYKLVSFFLLVFNVLFYMFYLFRLKLTSVKLKSGIRDHIISKAMCVCGATNILADDLLPNKTLRDTINRIMEAGNSSPENAGSLFQVQGLYYNNVTLILAAGF